VCAMQQLMPAHPPGCSLNRLFLDATLQQSEK
jgi:hypothetical protein